MRPVRFYLLILAMLSLALLPGPAHALAHNPVDVTHKHHAIAHLHHATAESFATQHHHDRSGHRHGPACDMACCAPMCSLYAPPTIAVTRVGHALPAPLPTSDSPRPDAHQPRSLRPPETT